MGISLPVCMWFVGVTKERSLQGGMSNSENVHCLSDGFSFYFPYVLLSIFRNAH
jgi:putative hemolysin